MKRLQDSTIHDWPEWEALCLKHGQDPWAVGEIVTDYTHDNYSVVVFRGERPERPADHDDAPGFLTVDCAYCHEPGWAADMTRLVDGRRAHPVCHQAVQEQIRAVARLGQ
jgi:hypothetical protein